MASSTYFSLVIFTLLISTLLISTTIAQPSFRPKGLLYPAIKEPTTLQYYTQFYLGTPRNYLDLTIDLGGQFLWTDCDRYTSSTYRPSRCGSAQCSLAQSNSCATCNGPSRPGCNNNTCGLFPDNTLTHTATSGDLGSDYVEVRSQNGKNPGPVVSVRNFLFVCGSTFLLDGLAPDDVRGMAGLGRTRISLPSQFSAAFSFPRKFSVCLSSSTSATGLIFFGETPTNFLPNVDVSNSLIYTPLILNPVSTASTYTTGDPSSDYFIGVKSIKVGEKNVNINTTLLTINQDGYGGTKISTVDPYTVLETSIYKAVVDAFVRELSGVPRVASVAPFSACFSAKNISSTRVGPGVPAIDLVLQSESVYWRIFGGNSMVRVNDDVLCLGFVDGGVNPRTSIVIGGHQIEENLLEFDLARSRLGFSSSLFFRQTTCSNFNMTVID